MKITEKIKGILGTVSFFILVIITNIFPLDMFRNESWWIILFLYIIGMVISLSFSFMYFFKTLHKNDYDRFKKYK